MKTSQTGLLSAFLVFMTFVPSTVMSGNVTYTTTKASNPTADQSDAYAKIKIAMDSATLFYNTYTTITKQVTVTYNTSVPTADGNINGSIRFGANRSYMVCGTAMHEIAHTVGVGTCDAWPGLIVNGRYIGASANSVFRTIIGNPDTVLHGDSQHFWPYGINYESEVKSSADLIDHCKIVNAMQKDFYPSMVTAPSLRQDNAGAMIIMKSKGIVSYRIPVSCSVEIRVVSLSGRIVAALKQGTVQAGEHTVQIKSSLLLPGFYVCELVQDGMSNLRTAALCGIKPKG